MANTFTAVASGNWSDTATWGGGVAAYGNDSNCVLLVHGDGDCLDTSVGDGNSPHTPTSSGITYSSTAGTYKFGQSINFGGGSGYVWYPDSTDWTFGAESGHANDFVIDFWYKFNSQPADSIFLGQAQNASHGWYLEVWTVSTTTYVHWYSYSDSGGNVQWTMPYDTNLHHFAILRSGTGFPGNWYCFVDGSPLSGKVASGTVTTNDDVAANLYIGQTSGGAYPFTGYMDELRISKGTDRGWSGGFTPPNQAYYAGTTYPFSVVTTDIVNIPTYTVTITANAPMTGTGAVTVYNNGTLINAFNQSSGQYGAIVADLSTNGTVEFNANCVLKCQSIYLDTTGIVDEVTGNKLVKNGRRLKRLGVGRWLEY